jgi:hypothetical protein
MAIRKISAAGLKPEGCASSVLCADSYSTFIQVVIGMDRVPTEQEILMMTAGTEYYNQAERGDVRTVGKEGLARNYYQACKMDGCQGNELYKFMEGFQPWYGNPSLSGDGSAEARAGKLLNRGLYNIMDKDLRKDTAQIADKGYASGQGWTQGKLSNRPWQWFTFTKSPDRKSTFGYLSTNDAILEVDLGNGQV